MLNCKEFITFSGKTLTIWNFFSIFPQKGEPEKQRFLTYIS